MTLTLDDIRAAQGRIHSAAHSTPILRPYSLERMLGCSLFLKAEMLQRTGSFKIRGAYNKLTQLTPVERERGVIAASAGNHAQGVAVAAALAGITATVVMPERASQAKVNASRAYGAEVILHGAHFREAREHALRLQKERGLVLIHGFDDEAVIAGQGTIGLEILDTVPDLDVVVVPVGGGGLIAGIATAVKAVRPQVRIVGVQAEAAPAAIRAYASGKLETVPVGETLADGIAIERPGDIPFEIMRRLVDEMVTVTEEEIKQAVNLLLQRSKLLAEGAGAAPLAALLGKKTAMVGQRVVLVLSGGNIDLSTLATFLRQPASSVPGPV